MTLEEVRAWLEKNAAVLRCEWCRGRWVVGEGVVVVFHRCNRPVRRRPFDPPDREEERQAWARTLLGGALVDAIEARDGEIALLRSLEEEE